MIYMRIEHRKTTAAVDGNEELQLPHESTIDINSSQRRRERAAKGN